MTTTVTSRRADTGLPDVANDWAYADPSLGSEQGTYFDDGTTWTDHAGSVLSGSQPLPVRLRGRALRHAFGE